MKVVGVKNLAAIRAGAVARNNQDAESTRLRFVTPGAAQAMVYQKKVRTAERYVAAGAPEDLAGFPLIAREIGITAATAWEIVQIWLNLDSLWEDIGSRIESVRLSTNNAINTEIDPARIEDHRLNGSDAYRAIVQTTWGT